MYLHLDLELTPFSDPDDMRAWLMHLADLSEEYRDDVQALRGR